MVLLLVWFLAEAQAQDYGFTYEHYSILNGLPDNGTTVVMQDRRGFIWVGTNQGLSRFEGAVFKNFTKLGLNGLSDLNVYALAEDSMGNIWIGTQNGLNKLDPLTDSITQYYMGKGPGTIPYMWCNYLYVDKHKTLWLSTEKGLARYDAKTDCFHNYPIKVFGRDVKINKFISHILEDVKDRFWLATSYGIVRFDKNTLQSKTFLYEKDKINPSAYPVLSVAEDSKGDIWAGTWNDGILKYDEKKECFHVLSSANQSFKQYVISDIKSINFNQQECLFLATDLALVQMDLEAKTQAVYSFSDAGLGNFCYDRQGNLWITSWKGLYKMNLNSLAYKWLNLPKEAEKLMVYHIIPDRVNPENAFYLSTLEGWWYFDRKKQSIAKMELPNDQHKLLPAINHWIADSTGYWLTSMNGMGYYNTARNTLQTINSEQFGKASYNFTQSIVKDRQGKLWISVQRIGILVIDQRKGFSKLLFSDPGQAGSISGSDIRDMVLGPDGYIYFLANYGMYRVSSTSFEYNFARFPDSLSKVDKEKISPDNFCLTHDKKLLVSSKLRVYEYKNGVFTLLYPAEGYSDFMIEKIYNPSSGAFWLKTSKGIFRTNQRFTKWVNLNNRLGWSDDVYVNDIHFCMDGTIVLASKGRIGLLNDTTLKPSPTPPKVLISKLVYGGNSEYLPAEANSEIVLAHNESIEIELASVNFLYQKEVRMFYQLKGLNTEINELIGQNTVTYQQLPPGQYTFLVWQQNTEGVKSKLSSIKLIVKPPFYRTAWFLVSAALLIAGVVYLIFSYRIKKALELERLRTRIATDLHDDIGATLSAISLYAEALKTQMGPAQPNQLNILSKISLSSREMVGSMGDIVWAINPDNDFGQRMIERMHNYAADMCQAKDMVLHFESDQNLNALRLSLEYRRNIYLIFKEAMNNAAKYSKAKTIYITLQLTGNLIQMVVWDDGVGFDETLIRHGNGLKNMYSRAKSLGASLHISTGMGEGTTVSLSWGKHS